MKLSRRSSSLIICITVVISLIIISDIPTRVVNATDDVMMQMKRFMDVFSLVRKYYVEDINSEEVMTGAIQGMLEKLDPHSVYIEAEQLKTIDERFKGHYYGIGIEFVIKDKILTVISPIANSPSEALGLRPGDQIIKIEGKSAYGISEQEVFDQLRGPKGTKVTVTIRRSSIDEPFDVTIVRDEIPIYSVLTATMITDDIGYIYIGRFARTTVDELEESLVDLERQGMKALILDLRNNSGGYLDQAVRMSDKFLNGKKKIVYTRGRLPESNEDYFSTDETTHPEFPLIIMINKGSASASEIVAGAMQDWDRALVVGETSFGKGLVQNQIPLKDGSALRLTTARYFTPSGRLIQRPYDKGIIDYYEEGYDDVDPNAIEDSLANRPVFYTSNGRKVYGGGGITPDVTIKSGRVTAFTNELLSKRLFFAYAEDYTSKRHDLDANFKNFQRKFIVSDQIIQNFKNYVVNKDVEWNTKSADTDLDYIKLLIKSELARHVWDSKHFYAIRMTEDEQVLEAIKLFPQAAEIAGIDYNRSLKN
ncbi:PDZ domain-containing protein [candidate division KSB1 bacterium]|nr:PDZ domain-containing protein [candidate division KSB1 bacterium]